MVYISNICYLDMREGTEQAREKQGKSRGKNERRKNERRRNEGENKSIASEKGRNAGTLVAT